MYRHLLVPIDDTDRSIEVVGNAVGLARAVGARVTFCHAAADAGRAGKAGELLAKAEAAARAFGVPCDSRHVVSDEPAAAIVAAARGGGCDLVFMASPVRGGRPGTARAPRTLRGVLDAGVPVLVSGVGDPGPPAHAIGLIRDEHRSLAAVLHAWMDTLAAARSAGCAADPRLMRSIVRHIEASSIALHDTKEEEHLFRRLRKRTRAVDAELDELKRQHARDRQLVAELAARIDTLAGADGEAALTATRELDDAVRGYAAFVWEHLGREEGVILPAAKRHLTRADWSAIDAEFVKNRDSRFGGKADKAVRRLVSRIGNAARAEP